MKNNQKDKPSRVKRNPKNSPERNPERNTEDVFDMGSEKSSEKYRLFNNFFDNQLAMDCYSEIMSLPEDLYLKYNWDHEMSKWTFNRFEEHCPPAIRKALDYMNWEFVNIVDEFAWALTMPDHAFVWWWVHVMLKWGILRPHLDFNILPATLNEELQWLRVCNLIVYLNPHRKHERGGSLELDIGETITVQPEFNTAVLFDTRDVYHWMNQPYTGDLPRVSLAAYYYIQVPKWIIKPHSTVYKPLDNETPEQKKEREDRAKVDRYSNPSYQSEFKRFYNVNGLEW